MSWMEERGIPVDEPWGGAVRMQSGGHDVPAHGGPNFDAFRALTPRPHEPGERAVLVIARDSLIFAVEFSDPVRAMTLVTYGNATQPGNPHCGDQLELYAHNRMRDALLERSAIEAALELREDLET